MLLVPQRGSAFFAAIAGKDGRLFLFDRSGSWLEAPPTVPRSEMFLRAVLFHRSRRRRPHRDEPRPSHSELQDSNDEPVAGGNISNHFHWTRQRLLHHGFVPRQRRIRQLREYADHLGGFTSHIQHIRCRPFCIFGFGGKRELPAALRSGERGTLAKYRRQREYCSDCLEWAGLCRFLGNPGDTEPRRNGRRRRAACGSCCASGGVAWPAVSPNTAFVISGTLHSVNGSVLTFTNRHGKERLIDASGAIKKGQIAPALTLGEAYTALGSSLTSTGELHADVIYRAKCRQHNEVGGDLTAQPACTGDQWPTDKDPGQ